jgi:hypothetical protein
MAVGNQLQDQIKKLKQRKELLVILMFFFVIVIFWIGIGLFSSQQKLGITPEQKKLSSPLTPNIDVATLEKLEQKKKFTDYELLDFPIYILYQDGGEIKKIDVKDGLPSAENEVEVSSEEAQEIDKIDDIILEIEE